MKVLFLGIKQWPANSGINRAGGSATFCDLLIKGFNDKVHCIIVTQKARNQKKYDRNGNIETYRISTIHNRVYKLVFGSLFCTIKAYFLLRDKRVDIINAHTAWAAFYAWFLAKITNIPLVV